MDKYGLTDDGRKLNELGRKYIDLVGNGEELSYRTRTSEQITAANEIVMESRGFIDHVASRIISDGWEIKRGTVLSLRGLGLNWKDLVNEGISKVLENLHNYNPKYAMTSFIGLCAATAMYNSVPNESLIGLPGDVFSAARIAMGDSDYVGRETIEDISLNISRKKLTPHTLDAIYTVSSGSDFLSIDKDVEIDGEKEAWQESFLTYEGAKSVEGLACDEELIEKVSEILRELSSRRERVIRRRFGIGGVESTLEDNRV